MLPHPRHHRHPTLSRSLRISPARSVWSETPDVLRSWKQHLSCLRPHYRSKITRNPHSRPSFRLHQPQPRDISREISAYSKASQDVHPLFRRNRYRCRRHRPRHSHRPVWRHNPASSYGSCCGRCPAAHHHCRQATGRHKQRC